MAEMLLTPTWLAKEACYLARRRTGVWRPVKVVVHEQGYACMWATAKPKDSNDELMVLRVPLRLLKKPIEVARRYLVIVLRGR